MTVSTQSIVVWSIFVIFQCISGFRWDVGIDWAAYHKTFGANMMALFTYSEHFEIGNIALKLLLQANGFYDSRYWIWVMSFITLFCIFYGINKYSKQPLYSILLFVLLGMYFDSLNGIRQYCAIAISMLAWQFVWNRSFVRYCIVILVAAMFHKSVLLLIPLYFVLRHTFSKKMLVWMMIAAVPLAFIITPIVAKMASLIPSYEVYRNSAYTLANSNVLSYARMIFPIILFVLTLQVYDRLTVDFRSRVLLNLSLCGMFCTVLFPNVQLMIRISFYFQLAYIIFIPILCSHLSQRNCIVIKIFTVVYGLLFLYLTLFSKPITKIIPFTLDFTIADINLLLISLISLLIMSAFVVLLRWHEQDAIYK